GPVAMPPPLGARGWPVVSAQEMFAAAIDLWIGAKGGRGCDLAIMTAAVADFRPASRAAEKLKKQDGQEHMHLSLTRNPDILALLSAWSGVLVHGRRRGVIGFAAETGDAVRKGREKLARKRCDLLVVNDVAAPECGFGADTNAVTLIGRDGREEVWPLLPKEAVASRLIQVAAALLDT
ncbi:MAG: phosphopantothenoylcysteine decarboxylase, partial [Magnetococcales bacterium]|nr:phosphopantothenoylcysteine decarboxylase [Magnetococcales bacterium]